MSLAGGPTGNARDRKAISLRRAWVARFKAQGLATYEIVDALDRQGLNNPRTKRPYNLTTIKDDLKALDAEWRVSAAREIDDHKAKLYAELEEVKRVAWTERSLKTIVMAIEQQMRLMGLVAPQRVKIDIIQRVREVAAQMGLTDEDASSAIAEAERMFGARG